jgi:hypothetical protein
VETTKQNKEESRKKQKTIVQGTRRRVLINNNIARSDKSSFVSFGEEIFRRREADVRRDDTVGTSGSVVETGRHMRRDGRGP